MSATLSVTYSREGDKHTINTGGAALGDIVIDNTPIPADQRGGTAKQLLAASALFCYCSALVSALDARGAKYSNLRATAVLHMDNNAVGQSRIQKIVIEARVNLPEEDEDVFERCVKIMRQGCLVTGSLHDGIKMEYDLQAEYED